MVFINGGGADKHGRPQVKCRYGEREVGAGHAVGLAAMMNYDDAVRWATADPQIAAFTFDVKSAGSLKPKQKVLVWFKRKGYNANADANWGHYMKLAGKP